MGDLLQTLQVQHQDIVQLEDEVDRALGAGDAAALSELLLRLKRTLLAHLELEDARLYPGLLRAAEKTRADIPLKVADTFAKNMQSVTAALKAFLDRYVASQIDIADLRRDWPLVRRLLDDRIESEERQLYPLYRSWHG